MKKISAVLIVGFTVAFTYFTTYFLSAREKSEGYVIWIDRNDTDESVNNYNTYCPTFHRKGNERVSGQRVVSFTFYGPIEKKQKYFEGIQKNVELLQQYYPGWIMRVYHNATPDTKAYSAMEELERKYENLDFCNILYATNLGNVAAVSGSIWRFIPMADPMVDIFLSRDLDSVIYPREVAAVQEWLDTNYTFHIMRDHPWHTTKILAGMWGARISYLRSNFSQLLRTMITKGTGYWSYGIDQKLLAEIIWPLTDGDGIHHDSYHCTKPELRHKFMRPFPTKRENNDFVGSRKRMKLNDKCPLQCRGEPEWTSC